MKPNFVRTPLILLTLFLAAWVPRVVALDAVVTADERKWLARSANFAYAIQTGDLAATYQHEHPGVTVMWAGAAGLLQRFPQYVGQAPGYWGWDVEEIEPWLRASTAHTPLELLDAGRWWVTVVVAGLIALAFLPLRRLLGGRLALLALLFIAWMPWAVALTRQLHPDGLLAASTFVAMTYFLAWLYGGRRRRDLIAGGVLLGLACLTKAPAGFLVVVGLLLVTAYWEAGRRHGSASAEPVTAIELLRGVALWVVVAAATFFLLWPALWVNPVGTLAHMFGDLTEYLEGHTNSNYFMGQIVDDTGPLFYPLVYLVRATPATLLGLLVAFVAAVRRLPPFDAARVRQVAGAYTFYALLFGLLLTLPGKKFDRYLLPSFWGLEVVAAAGWFALILLVFRWAATPHGMGGHTQLVRLRTRAAFLASAVALSGLVGLHGSLTALHFPYYLTYFNPLLGGGRTATFLTMVGWGEGFDQVATWLNDQPGADSLRVATWYADGPLSYYFRGTAIPLLAGSRMPWVDTDYVVLYQNQIQRRLPTEAAVSYLLAQPPVHVARFRGIELARVYDLRKILADAGQGSPQPDRAVFLGSRWPGLQMVQTCACSHVELGGVLPVKFVVTDELSDDHRLSVRLFSADNTLIAQKDMDLSSELEMNLFVPPDAIAGAYTLKAMIYDSETLDPIPSIKDEWEVDVMSVIVLSSTLEAMVDTTREATTTP